MTQPLFETDAFSKQIGKYLCVWELPQRPGLRTRQWNLYSMSGDCLALIKWYGSWRQYIVEPKQGTVFNEGCLSDIAAFLRDCNATQRRRQTEVPR